ncbi:MAG TPA: methylated-DNA--[protein]-cysteine S-methyltransferase [Thermoanaerobaculia bacterium]|nr:methylated-DNA--[protein]-cysteine S-methyltransferase [Thermoanaerobaculia bacterium]
MPSPIGRLGIEFRDQAVTRLVVQPSALEAKQFQSLHDVELTDFLTEAIGRLSEYFAGVRADPAIAVDLTANDLDDFSRRVLTEVCRIPYGKTWTYKKLAEACGRREAPSQVRRILAANPIPVLVPCHRVVPERGGAGAWIGGTRKKEKLIRIERRASAPAKAS